MLYKLAEIITNAQPFQFDKKRTEDNHYGFTTRIHGKPDVRNSIARNRRKKQNNNICYNTLYWKNINCNRKCLFTTECEIKRPKTWSIIAIKDKSWLIVTKWKVTV